MLDFLHGGVYGSHMLKNTETAKGTEMNEQRKTHQPTREYKANQFGNRGRHVWVCYDQCWHNSLAQAYKCQERTAKAIDRRGGR